MALDVLQYSIKFPSRYEIDIDMTGGEIHNDISLKL